MITTAKKSENYQISGDLLDVTISGYITMYSDGAITIDVNCSDGTTGNFHRNVEGNESFNAYYASEEPKVDFIQAVFAEVMSQVQD